MTQHDLPDEEMTLEEFDRQIDTVRYILNWNAHKPNTRITSLLDKTGHKTDAGFITLGEELENLWGKRETIRHALTSHADLVKRNEELVKALECCADLVPEGKPNNTYNNFCRDDVLKDLSHPTIPSDLEGRN